MENKLIVISQQSLRNIAKTLTALKLQITQLENQVKELRLNLLKGGQNVTGNN